MPPFFAEHSYTTPPIADILAQRLPAGTVYTCEPQPSLPTRRTVEARPESAFPPPASANDSKNEIVADIRQKYGHNIHIVGAYIHLDETSPHVHVDYIPVKESGRGLRVQNSLNGAMEQATGYKSQSMHDTAQIYFQGVMRERFREICFAHGVDTAEIEQNDREHLTILEYKKQRIKQETQQLEERAEEALETITHADRIVATCREEVRAVQEENSILRRKLDTLVSVIKTLPHDVIRYVAETARDMLTRRDDRDDDLER